MPTSHLIASTRQHASTLILLACWLGTIVLAGSLTLSALPVDLGPAYQWQAGYPAWLQALLRWDANHYAAITSEGYTSVIQPAFFPLFPLLAAGVHALGVPLGASGLLVSWAAALFALTGLKAIAEDYFPERMLSRRVLLAFLLAPGAFFLASFYTESLFCALAFWAFAYARRGEWWKVGVALGFLTATRLPAIVVVLAVLVEHLAQRGWNPQRLDRSSLWLLLAPTGLLAYLGYSKVVLGDALAFLHAYDTAWKYQKFNPNVPATIWHEVTRLTHLVTAPGGVDPSALYSTGIGFACWVGCLAVTLAGIRKIPWSYTALSLGTLVFVSLNSNFQAINRYTLVLFPVILILVQSRALRSEERWTGMLLLSGGVMLTSLVLFTHGVWMG